MDNWSQAKPSISALPHRHNASRSFLKRLVALGRRAGLEADASTRCGFRACSAYRQGDADGMSCAKSRGVHLQRPHRRFAGVSTPLGDGGRRLSPVLCTPLHAACRLRGRASPEQAWSIDQSCKLSTRSVYGICHSERPSASPVILVLQRCGCDG